MNPEMRVLVHDAAFENVAVPVLHLLLLIGLEHNM